MFGARARSLHLAIMIASAGSKLRSWHSISRNEICDLSSQTKAQAAPVLQEKFPARGRATLHPVDVLSSIAATHHDLEVHHAKTVSQRLFYYA